MSTYRFLTRCVQRRFIRCSTTRIPHCIKHFTINNTFRSTKKNSPYSTVDSGRYSYLVKSVVSSRVSSQTPETLEKENEQMYGPVVKSQTSTRSERTSPKIIHPFLNDNETHITLESEFGTPARILLERGQNRSAIPSVTRILQQTMSPEQIFYLERWKRRLIADLGEEGFNEYSQNLFRQGKLFHTAVEDILSSDAIIKGINPTEPSVYPPEVQGYMQSISPVLEDICQVRAIESTIQHDTLNYLGVVDCVAHYRGVLCVIDWKTSEKPKPYLSNTYDNPLQVAAYTGALNTDANYNYQVQHGLIVVAYKDGSPADAHQMSYEQMLEYWKRWLVRLEKFAEKS